MKHEGEFSIPKRELGKADIEFSVKRGGQKFGTLKVSKGSLVWVPRDNTYGFKVGWDQFDVFIKDHGTSEKH